MSRTLFSSDSDWELADGTPDVRGYVALDGAGAPVGRVASLVVDTDAELVSSVILDTGDEVPAFDITIGQGVVYLAGAIPGAATAGDVPEALRHRIARRVVPVMVPEVAVPVASVAGVPVSVAPAAVSAPHVEDFRAHHAAQLGAAGRGYDAVQAAYQYGYAAAHAAPLQGRPYPDAEPALRAAYPGPDFEADREAVQYGYHRAQRTNG
ncbi:MAG TPA: hypothetical protein VF576_12385 [Rubricoccaceae bacterium]|jgi:hypothetical protein